MTRTKKLIAKFTAFFAAVVILPVALLADPEAAIAAEVTITCGVSGSFTVVDNVVTEQNLCTGTATIPEGVTAINAWVFFGSAVTNVVIAASVLTIGQYAFGQTELLNSVSFAPGSVLTIMPPWAFWGSSLRSIELPKSLTTIDSYAFDSVQYLTTVLFPLDGNLRTIAHRAFSNTSLQTLHFPETLQSIGSYAFTGSSSLTSLTFEGNPLDVQSASFDSIGSNPVAFRKSSLAGFGPSGGYWNGLRVVGMVQVNCYQPLQDRTFILGTWGIQFLLFGCLNPADGSRANNNTPYLVTEAGSVVFTPQTGSAATYTILPTPAFSGQTFGLSLDVAGRPSTIIRDSLTGTEATGGVFSLAPGSELPAGVTMSPTGVIEVTDTTSLPAGSIDLTVYWTVSEGVGNAYDQATNSAVAKPYSFTAAANFTLTLDPEIVIAAAISGAPTAVSAVARSASAAVSWLAPASNGGSDITTYTVTSNDGQTCITASLSCTVTRLTINTDYTFSVKATNAIGTSSPSAASASVRTVAEVTSAPEAVTGTETPKASDLPSEPLNVEWIAKFNTVTISWSAPTSSGLSPTLNYLVEANGGLSCTTTKTTCEITGLASGISYNFAVSAVNAQGKSKAATSASGSLLIRKLLRLGSSKTAANLSAAAIRAISHATLDSSKPIRLQLTLSQNSSKTKLSTFAPVVRKQLALIKAQLAFYKLSLVTRVTYKYLYRGTSSEAATTVLVIH